MTCGQLVVVTTCVAVGSALGCIVGGMFVAWLVGKLGW